jgi:SAM-dependent methyltransferase
MADAPHRSSNALPIGPDRTVEFDSAYEGTPPWDIGHPQPAFLAVARSGALVGRVLDVGCGTGEHALMAAELGLDATGIDFSAKAIRLAENKARERSLDTHFLVADALELESRGGQYDTVLDCGLFHVFDDRDRARFVRSLSSIVVPGGCYFMLCFSDLQPGDWGPRRVSRAEISSSFADGWRVVSVESSRIEITIDPEVAQAWLAVITRT